MTNRVGGKKETLLDKHTEQNKWKQNSVDPHMTELLEHIFCTVQVVSRFHPVDHVKSKLDWHRFSDVQGPKNKNPASPDDGEEVLKNEWNLGKSPPSVI